jgi:competence protein ComGC
MTPKKPIQSPQGRAKSSEAVLQALRSGFLGSNAMDQAGIVSARAKDHTRSPGTKLARAFTVTELLVIIACLVLLAALLLPALARLKAPHSNTYCANNLKEIGVAFKTWLLDNNDHFPMQVSVTNGGTMELAASGAVFHHFQVMSNELSTPIILVCPEDKERTPATNFTSDLDDKKLSYFVGLDSAESIPSSWLSGDRNFTNRLASRGAFLTLTTNQSLGWGKGIHHKKGNLCFADGDVGEFNNGSLQQAIRAVGGTTNRLAIP